eukprot:6613911-Prymnesium_polylepis.1
MLEVLRPAQLRAPRTLTRADPRAQEAMFAENPHLHGYDNFYYHPDQGDYKAFARAMPPLSDAPTLTVQVPVFAPLLTLAGTTASPPLHRTSSSSASHQIQQSEVAAARSRSPDTTRQAHPLMVGASAQVVLVLERRAFLVVRGPEDLRGTGRPLRARVCGRVCDASSGHSVNLVFCGTHRFTRAATRARVINHKPVSL